MEFLTLLCLVPAAACTLTAKDNKYDDLLIAISPDVEENKDILKELQSMVTDASGYLYKATKKRIRFGRVKILIPDSWKKDPAWKISSTQTFDEAHIRVDKTNPTQGNNPYTFQPRQCGEPGDYIHFTPEYLLDSDGKRSFTWGPTGRTLVHEFSHLRYGVFDEYGEGTDTNPNFYLHDDNTLMPTACPVSIKRGSYYENGQEVESCTINPETHLPGSNCTFVPDLVENRASASIMYDQSQTKIFTFCESNTKDPGRLHSTTAPNKHNRLCAGKATWDIVIGHDDFKNKNPPVDLKDQQLKPEIVFLYNEKKRLPSGAVICGRPVVLVLDLSGSMVDKVSNRYFKQSQTADKLIRDILPVGTKFGLVTFSNNATTLVPITTLDSQKTRDEIAKRLPKKTDYGGYTFIGGGLLEAKTLLESGDHVDEGRIILITDGEENIHPFVAEMKTNITSTPIKVHAIAYSSAAAKSIKNISEETGGLYAYYSESPESSVLDSIIQSIMKDVSLCRGHNKIEIMRVSKKMNPPYTASGDMVLDSTVGNDTMFVFTLPVKSRMKVTLKDPEGKTYSRSSREYSKDEELNIVRFSFPRAKNGTWHYTIESTKNILTEPTKKEEIVGTHHRGKPFRDRKKNPDSVSIVVKALPTDKEPYEVKSWLSSMTVDPNNKKPTVAYVHVHKGYAPVTFANVTITVERPRPAKPAKFTLKDDGAAPDNVANDGVYTMFFTNFTGNNRYSWDVDVNTAPLQAGDLVLATFPKLPTLSLARARYQNATPPIIMEVAERFSRTSSPGAMDVSGYVPGKDYYPPIRVSDFKVSGSDSRAKTVMLEWTAPGDDFTSGRATRYDLRQFRKRRPKGGNSLDISDRSQWRPLLQTDIVRGTFTPRSAGSREKIKIKIRDSQGVVKLALWTLDDDNNLSEMSNIVSTTFKQPKMSIKGSYLASTSTTSTTSTTTTSTTSTTTASSTSTTTSTTSTTTASSTSTTTTSSTSTTSASTKTTLPNPTTTTATNTPSSTDTTFKLYTSTVMPYKLHTKTTAAYHLNNINPKESNKNKMERDIAIDEDERETVLLQNSHQGNTNEGMHGPSKTMIAIIVSSTIGLIIVIAVVAVVISKLIITRVHASNSDLSLSTLKIRSRMP